MDLRAVSLIFGVLFVFAGIAGFVPGLTSPMPPGAPRLVIDHGHGLALGLLPVNTLHNLVHLLFGAMGLAAYGGMLSSRLYLQIVAVAYGLLAVMGLVPGLNTVFGLVPIYGNDVWFHVLLAVPAAYFGFAASPATHESPTRSVRL